MGCIVMGALCVNKTNSTAALGMAVKIGNNSSL